MTILGGTMTDAAGQPLTGQVVLTPTAIVRDDATLVLPTPVKLDVTGGVVPPVAVRETGPTWRYTVTVLAKVDGQTVKQAEWLGVEITGTSIAISQLVPALPPIAPSNADVLSARIGTVEQVAGSPAVLDSSVASLVGGAGETGTALDGRYGRKPDWDTLTRWHVALARRDTKPATVVVLGDSIGEGGNATTPDNRWLARLQAELRRRYPTTGLGVNGTGGGAGFIPCRRGSGILTGYPPVTITGPAPQTNDLVGFAGRAYRLTAASGTALTWSVTGTAVDVIYYGTPGSGKFNVKVDGGAASADVVTDTTATGGGTQGKAYRVPLGASGAHTVTVTQSGSQTPYIGGIYVYDGDEAKGVHVVDYSQAGWRAENFADSLTEIADDMSLLLPDLVIVILGANDWSAQRAISTFTTKLTTIRDRILAGSPDDPAFLIMALPQRGDFTPQPITYPWDSYITALQTVFDASTRGADTVDFRERYPAPGVDNSLGIIDASLVHSGDTGNAYFAQIIADHIRPE